MRHLFIVNPTAGRGESLKKLEKLVEAVFAPGEWQILHTEKAGDARDFARRAAQSGEDVRIYACGGDGTLNEVAAGAAGFPNAAVTHFPGGSGNDFVKLFSQPGAFFDLDRLMDPEEVSFDMIRCNDDFCLNICSVGLDARIGTDVANYKRLPLLHGFRAYIASTVINVIRGVGEHFVVQVNGETIDREETMICVCNGRFYGGGFNPVPQADPTDGILDVLVVKSVKRRQVPGVVGKYKNGRYRELPELVRHISTNKLTIICDGPTAVNLDGELRRAERLEISVAEEKLRFFYPRGLTWQAKEPAGV